MASVAVAYFWGLELTQFLVEMPTLQLHGSGRGLGHLITCKIFYPDCLRAPAWQNALSVAPVLVKLITSVTKSERSGLEGEGSLWPVSVSGQLAP